MAQEVMEISQGVVLCISAGKNIFQKREIKGRVKTHTTLLIANRYKIPERHPQ